MVDWLPPSVILFISIGSAIPAIRMALRLKKYVRDYPYTVHGDVQWPDVVVIVPCKGQHNELPHLLDNLRPMMEQDYPDYRVIFSVFDENDLALPILNQLCQEYEHATVVVAESGAGRSQKLTNQLRALQDVCDRDEVFIFMDSDARPAGDVLKQLVVPLKDKSVGVTTGYRWYTPSKEHGGFGSWLRAAWNAGGLSIIVHPKYSYAWGGAMAIRREVFDKCEIGAFWSVAGTDDLSMSGAVKSAGYRAVLAPGCVVQSVEDMGLVQSIEWTSRQTVICRVYNPVMWRDLFLGETITLASIVGMCMVFVSGVLSGKPLWVSGGALAIGVHVCTRLAYQRSILGVVEGLSRGLVTVRDRRRLMGFSLLVTPLIVYNSVRSWVNRRITWRGIRYHLKGPRDVEILSSS